MTKESDWLLSNGLVEGNTISSCDLKLNSLLSIRSMLFLTLNIILNASIII